MKTRWWILLFAALALVCGLSAVLLGGSRGGEIAAVYLDNELVREIDLSRQTESFNFTLSSPYGENTICVENGTIYVLNADCPDGTCVRHAPLPASGTPIVCLPHRLVIRMLSDTGDFDAVAGVAG